MATGTGDAGAGASVAPLFPMRSDSAFSSDTGSSAGSNISLTPRVSWADLPQPSDEDLLELCQLTSQPEQHDLNRKERRRTSREVRRNSANNVMTMPVAEAMLRQAANKCDYSSVAMYIEKGANPSASDNRGRTALHFASAKGDLAMVRLLLSRNANPNVVDANGNTPLHLAACTNHTEVITALLQAGTNIHAKDGSGRTPLEYAQSHLRFLTKFAHKWSCQKYKEKIGEVVRLLSEFLSRAGNRTRACGVDALGARLETLSTHEDLDQLSVLLGEFASMSVGSSDT